MKSVSQTLSTMLILSMLTMNLPSVPSFSSSAYAKAKVDVTKVVSNMISDLKKAKSAEDKKSTIAVYSATLSNASKREIESALRKTDFEAFKAYKKSLKEINSSENPEETVKAIVTSTLEDKGASWAGCTVAGIGVGLIVVGVVLAIVGFTKKTNEDRIRENARQARQARKKQYEDDVYFLNNAVTITEDKIDNLETNISQVEQDLAEVNGKIDVITELIVNAGPNTDVEGLRVERNLLIDDRNALEFDVAEMREDLQALNNELNYYLIDENIEFELNQAEFDFNADVERITNTEEADVSLIDLRKSEKKNLLIAAGITAGLGTIGATSLGDCSGI